MEIPNNSLTEEIKEIVRLCEDLSEDYGDNASWFDPPATETELSDWEKKNGTKIPESYKEWLRFTDSSQIRNNLARFYGVQEMEVNSKYCPEDYIVIGELIGDGERLCFSKTTGEIIRFNHGEVEEHDSFKAILQETIRMGKGESGLSKEAEDLFLRISKANKAKRNFDKGSN